MNFKKICSICGKEFETQVYNKTYCNKEHKKICSVCGKEFIFDGDVRFFLNKTTCRDKKCINVKKQEATKNTNFKRYGSIGAMGNKKIKQKAKETMKKNYGVETPFHLKEVQEKAHNTQRNKHNGKLAWNTEKQQKTCLKKYGFKTFMESPEFKNKSNETNINKYGTIFPSQNKEISDKIKKSLSIRYKENRETKLKIKKEKEKLRKEYEENNPGKRFTNREKYKKTCLERYGVPYYVMTTRCRSYKTISKENINFYNFLIKNNIDSKLEFNIKNKSYDLIIKSKKLLIEINPTYTHNSTRGIYLSSGKTTKPKDKYYHYNKTKLAKENGYICIHKFDWMSNEEILELIKNIDKYKIVQEEPRLHWYKIRGKDYMLDKNFNKKDMLQQGYVEVYDDGILFNK